MATCSKCGGTFDEATGPCPACMNKAAATPGPATTPAPAAKNSSTKVIVIVCLAVFGVLLIFCVGILAAVAIPNFLSAKGRAEQRRAMSEVRSMATAVESFGVDMGVYPDSHGQVVPVADLQALADEVTQARSGQPSDFFGMYAGTTPTAQADGTPYYYAGNGQHYLLVALGSDKKCDGDLDQIVGAWMGPWPDDGPPVQPRTTRCYENDILIGDGDFLSAPEGQQSRCGDQGGHDGPPQFGEPN